MRLDGLMLLRGSCRRLLWQCLFQETPLASMCHPSHGNYLCLSASVSFSLCLCPPILPWCCSLQALSESLSFPLRAHHVQIARYFLLFLSNVLLPPQNQWEASRPACSNKRHTKKELLYVSFLPGFTMAILVVTSRVDHCFKFLLIIWSHCSVTHILCLLVWLVVLDWF